MGVCSYVNDLICISCCKRLVMVKLKNLDNILMDVQLYVFFLYFREYTLTSRVCEDYVTTFLNKSRLATSK